MDSDIENDVANQNVSDLGSTIFRLSKNEWQQDKRVWEIIADIFFNTETHFLRIFKSCPDYGYLKDNFPVEIYDPHFHVERFMFMVVLSDPILERSCEEAARHHTEHFTANFPGSGDGSEGGRELPKTEPLSNHDGTASIILSRRPCSWRNHPKTEWEPVYTCWRFEPVGEERKRFWVGLLVPGKPATRRKRTTAKENSSADRRKRRLGDESDVTKEEIVDKITKYLAKEHQTNPAKSEGLRAHISSLFHETFLEKIDEQCLQRFRGLKEEADFRKHLRKRKRIFAMCVGINHYNQDVGPLLNCENDAKLFASQLGKAHDVEVHLVTGKDSTNRQNLLHALRKFNESYASEASAPDLIFLSFACHAVQASGVVYILPSDFSLVPPYEPDVLREHAISFDHVVLSWVNKQLETLWRGGSAPGSKPPATIFFLDVCRNSPSNLDFRLDIGVSKEKVRGNTVVLFSKGAGDRAEDGRDGNSPFALHLAGELFRSGASAHTALAATCTHFHSGPSSPDLTGFIDPAVSFVPPQCDRDSAVLGAYSRNLDRVLDAVDGISGAGVDGSPPDRLAMIKALLSVVVEIRLQIARRRAARSAAARDPLAPVRLCSHRVQRLLLELSPKVLAHLFRTAWKQAIGEPWSAERGAGRLRSHIGAEGLRSMKAVGIELTSDEEEWDITFFAQLFSVPFNRLYAQDPSLLRGLPKAVGVVDGLRRARNLFVHKYIHQPRLSKEEYDNMQRSIVNAHRRIMRLTAVVDRDAAVEAQHEFNEEVERILREVDAQYLPEIEESSTSVFEALTNEAVDDFLDGVVHYASANPPAEAPEYKNGDDELRGEMVKRCSVTIARHLGLREEEGADLLDRCAPLVVRIGTEAAELCALVAGWEVPGVCPRSADSAVLAQMFERLLDPVHRLEALMFEGFLCSGRDAWTPTLEQTELACAATNAEEACLWTITREQRSKIMCLMIAEACRSAVKILVLSESPERAIEVGCELRRLSISSLGLFGRFNPIPKGVSWPSLLLNYDALVLTTDFLLEFLRGEAPGSSVNKAKLIIIDGSDCCSAAFDRALHACMQEVARRQDNPAKTRLFSMARETDSIRCTRPAGTSAVDEDQLTWSRKMHQSDASAGGGNLSRPKVRVVAASPSKQWFDRQVLWLGQAFSASMAERGSGDDACNQLARRFGEILEAARVLADTVGASPALQFLAKEYVAFVFQQQDWKACPEIHSLLMQSELLGKSPSSLSSGLTESASPVQQIVPLDKDGYIYDIPTPMQRGLVEQLAMLLVEHEIGEDAVQNDDRFNLIVLLSFRSTNCKDAREMLVSTISGLLGLVDSDLKLLFPCFALHQAVFRKLLRLQHVATASDLAKQISDLEKQGPSAKYSVLLVSDEVAEVYFRSSENSYEFKEHITIGNEHTSQEGESNSRAKEIVVQSRQALSVSIWSSTLQDKTLSSPCRYRAPNDPYRGEDDTSANQQDIVQIVPQSPKDEVVINSPHSPSAQHLVATGSSSPQDWKGVLDNWLLRMGAARAEYRTNQVNPGVNHVPIFCCIVTAMGQNFDKKGDAGQKKKEVEKMAAQEALAALQKLSAEAESAERGSELARSPSQPPEGNWKGLLDTWLLKNKFPLAQYNSEKSGEDHVPVFTCFLDAMGKRSTKVGSSGQKKRDVEQSAAQEFYEANCAGGL